jgi:predicted membrane-bound mannosyltransferase
MSRLSISVLPPLVALLLLAGVSLSAVFLLGRGLFPDRDVPTLRLAGHGGLVCFGVCALHFLTRLVVQEGSDQARSALLILALGVMLAGLWQRLFRGRSPPPQR